MHRTLPLGRYILIAAVMLALSPLASAATPPKSAPPVHRGLYFNADFGFGNSRHHFTAANLRSDALNMSLRLGYALNTHLVLSAATSTSVTAENPKLNGYSLYPGQVYNLGSDLFGVDVTWYFGDDLLVGFTAGTGRTTVIFTDNSAYDSHAGSGTQIHIGKEWPVSKWWRLGIVGGVEHVTAGANTDPFEFTSLSVTTYFVGFTGTFN